MPEPATAEEVAENGSAIPNRDTDLQSANVDLDAIEEVAGDEELPVSLDAEEVGEDLHEEEEGEDQGEGEPGEDLIEIELDGETLAVPPNFKDAFMRTSDYSQKTEALAEQLRATEVERGNLEKVAQITQEELSSYARVQALEGQIAQYANVDWQFLEQQDPQLAHQHWRQYQQLKDASQDEQKRLGSLRGQRVTQQQEADKARLAATAKFARENIPNWSEDLDRDLIKFASEKGFSREQLTAAYTPQVYEMLYLASVGDKVLKQQRAARPKSNGQRKPTSKVRPKGRGGGQKPLAEMPMAEYARTRDAQEAKRRKTQRR